MKHDHYTLIDGSNTTSGGPASSPYVRVYVSDISLMPAAIPLILSQSFFIFLVLSLSASRFVDPTRLTFFPPERSSKFRLSISANPFSYSATRRAFLRPLWISCEILLFTSVSLHGPRISLSR